MYHTNVMHKLNFCWYCYNQLSLQATFDFLLCWDKSKVTFPSCNNLNALKLKLVIVVVRNSASLPRVNTSRPADISCYNYQFDTCKIITEHNRNISILTGNRQQPVQMNDEGCYITAGWHIPWPSRWRTIQASPLARTDTLKKTPHCTTTGNLPGTVLSLSAVSDVSPRLWWWWCGFKDASATKAIWRP